jgi:hypothetical protein
MASPVIHQHMNPDNVMAHAWHRAAVQPRTRSDAIAILRRRIEIHYWPRFGAFLIACATALAGLLFSAMLWRAGVEGMTWRYPISVMLSYLVLLTLLYAWSRRDWWDWLDPNFMPGGSGSGHEPVNGLGAGQQSGAFAGSGGEFGGAGASDSFDTFASEAGSSIGDTLGTGFDVAVSADEGIVIAIPLLLITGLLMLFGGFAFGLVSIIWNAPTLLAQLMIDAGTASMLMVYVRHAQRENWLSAALAKTLPKFVVLALIFTVAGYALEWFDPTAITVFDVWANR